jgi:hypothetical protein
VGLMLNEMLRVQRALSVLRKDAVEAA